MNRKISKEVYAMFARMQNRRRRTLSSGNTAFTLLGFVAAVLTAVSFVPETIKVVVNKQVSGLSVSFIYITLSSQFLWLVYSVHFKDLPLLLTSISMIVMVVPLLFMYYFYRT
ncbi:MAG: SemiSWEET family sugar transporter [Sulfobacillus sp.]